MRHPRITLDEVRKWYAAPVRIHNEQKAFSAPPAYLGAQFEKKGVKPEGFLGYLGEWDSNKGWSNNGLFEGGTSEVTAGRAVNGGGGENFVFAPVAEFGGLVAGSLGSEGYGALGGYAGTPGFVGAGGGGYVNITTPSGCQLLRAH